LQKQSDSVPQIKTEAKLSIGLKPDWGLGKTLSLKLLFKTKA